MWLDRDAYNPCQTAPSTSGTVPIQASYRRGILRTKVNVRDLTCAFAVIECMENPPVGTLIWLTLPGLEARAATVETSEGFRASIRFAQPFYPAIVDAFLSGSIRSYH